MFRSLFGFAILAVVGIVALKLVFALLGMAIGLFMTLVWWAVIGFVLYLIIKLISPSTARSIREMIAGKPAEG